MKKMNVTELKIGRQFRSASFTPASVNDAARTVDLVIATDTPVLMRAAGYYEVLSMDIGAVKMDRAAGGLPLFTDHTHSVLCQIGVVDNIRVDNGKLIGTATFSSRPDADAFFQDIKAGILRNISAGYLPLAYENTTSDPEAIYPTLTATSWEPFEVSLVGINADINTGMRSEEDHQATVKIVEAADEADQAQQTTEGESNMPAIRTAEEIAAEAANVENARSEAAKAASAAEITRFGAIRELVTSVKLDNAEEVASDLFTRGLSIEDARKAVLDAVAVRAKDTAVSGVRAEIVRDEFQTRSEGIAEALMHRANPGSDLSDKGRNFRGMSLVEIARDSLEAANIKTRGMTPNEIATRALQASSDFPAAISNTAERSLREGYMAAPQTFQPIVRAVNATSFKPIERVAFGEFGSLPKVAAGGEYTYATVGDGKEVYRVEKFGKIFGVDWETIVNDDLDVFTRVPAMWGRAASNTVSDLVWGIFTENPVMGDGVNLFDAAHANVSATTGAVNAASMAAAELLLLEQEGLAGEKLNLRPTHIIAAPARKVSVQQLLGTFNATKSSDINPFKDAGITPIIESRIGTGASTPWFIAAAGQIDTVEVAYLNGVQAPFLEQRVGFERDGLEWKARLVVGAKAIDFRPFVKIPG